MKKIFILFSMVFLLILTSCHKSNVTNQFKEGLYEGKNKDVALCIDFSVDLNFKLKLNEIEKEGTYKYINDEILLYYDGNIIIGKYNKYTLYITLNYNDNNYDFILTCYQKYTGLYTKHVDAMNTDITYNIEFFLYKDNTYKYISTYSALGATEEFEEKGYINIDNKTIKPKGMNEIKENISFISEESIVKSMILPLKTSSRSDERYIITLNII